MIPSYTERRLEMSIFESPRLLHPVEVIAHVDELSFFLSLSLSFHPFIHLTPASRTTTACILLPSPDTAQPTKMQFHTPHGSTTTTTQQHTNINCAPCDACIYFPAKCPSLLLLVPLPSFVSLQIILFYLILFPQLYLYILYFPRTAFAFFFLLSPFPWHTASYCVKRNIGNETGSRNWEGRTSQKRQV